MITEIKIIFSNYFPFWFLLNQKWVYFIVLKKTFKTDTHKSGKLVKYQTQWIFNWTNPHNHHQDRKQTATSTPETPSWPLSAATPHRHLLTWLPAAPVCSAFVLGRCRHGISWQQILFCAWSFGLTSCSCIYISTAVNHLFSVLHPIV